MTGKRKTIPIKRIILVVFITVLLAASVTLAAGNSTYDIAWWTIDGGGGTGSGGNYSLTGTIGQSDADTSAMSGGTYGLSGGFWGITGSSGGHKIYLPLVLKG